MMAYPQQYDDSVRLMNEQIATKDLRMIDHEVLMPASQPLFGGARVTSSAYDLPTEVRTERRKALQAAVVAGSGEGATQRDRDLYVKGLLTGVAHQLAVLEAGYGPLTRLSAVRHWPKGVIPGSIEILGELEGGARVRAVWHYLPFAPEYSERLQVLSARRRMQVELPAPSHGDQRSTISLREKKAGVVVETSHTATKGSAELMWEAFHSLVERGTEQAAGTEESRAQLVLMREVLEAIVAADGRSLDPEPEPGPGPDEAEAENAEAEAEGGASASGTAMDADAEPEPETGTASETAVGAETDAPHGTEATADAGASAGTEAIPAAGAAVGAEEAPAEVVDAWSLDAEPSAGGEGTAHEPEEQTPRPPARRDPDDSEQGCARRRRHDPTSRPAVHERCPRRRPPRPPAAPPGPHPRPGRPRALPAPASAGSARCPARTVPSARLQADPMACRQAGTSSAPALVLPDGHARGAGSVGTIRSARRAPGGPRAARHPGQTVRHADDTPGPGPQRAGF